jgi:hypothetical protein
MPAAIWLAGKTEETHDLAPGRNRSAQPRHRNYSAGFLDTLGARTPFPIRALQG